MANPIPQARVVRTAGQLVAAPPAPRDPKAAIAVGRALRNALYAAIAMWPLTAVMLLILGFIVMAGAVPIQFR